MAHTETSKPCTQIRQLCVFTSGALDYVSLLGSWYDFCQLFKSQIKSIISYIFYQI